MFASAKRGIGAMLLAWCMIGTSPGAARAAEIDPAVVGIWEVETSGGVRWIWEIARDGQYRLRSDPPSAIPEHQGRASFGSGKWKLSATAGLPGWTDGGTYQLRDDATLVAAGRLGKGVWQRTAQTVTIPPAPAAAVADAAPAPEPDTLPEVEAPDEVALTMPAPAEVEVAPMPAPTPPPAHTTPTMGPGVIRDRLLAMPIAALTLPPGFFAQSIESVAPTPTEAQAGVLAKVEVLMAGPDARTGHILFLLYADHATAAAGSDPSRSGLVFDLTVEGRDVAEDVLARCAVWQVAEGRSGVRCSRTEASLPVVVVGALSQDFLYQEIALGTQAQLPAKLLQSGTAMLVEALRQ